MDNLLISALSAVDVRDLSYAEWMLSLIHI